MLLEHLCSSFVMVYRQSVVAALGGCGTDSNLAVIFFGILGKFESRKSVYYVTLSVTFCVSWQNVATGVHFP